VLDRTDKMGFETPADHWLRTRHAGEVRRRLLAHGPLHDWVDPVTLAAELDDWFAAKREIGLQVWRWLSLESWARQLVAVDPRVVERPPEIQTHPGLHKSYVQVMEQLVAETDGAARTARGTGVAAG
jgi:hypothetical protein